MLGFSNIGLSIRPKENIQLLSKRFASFLGHLEPNEGAVKDYRRLGRGPSSGLGKTSGRGQKGQKARGKVPMWFEGGQTPFFKRFPKTGFNRANKRVFHQLKLERIQDFWDNGRLTDLKEGETLTIHHMRKLGLITGSLKDGVKILSNGKESYNVPLNIEASQASSQSIARIEELGQTFNAHYFTPLSLRAHISPDHFLRTRGYLPLAARPTHKRDVKYYSNPDKRGYLLKDRSLLLDFMGKTQERKKRVELSHLEKSLANASTTVAKDFTQSQTISLKDL
ncbi:54S ribosomal protein L10, mitochondrial [[Candida] railenensis]|uniref:54S ribosomal protein L10, mitochondrial n=1 Tax=[Candida] railenensis TaxID=45579 RepID=A0A9P0W1H6_9ASCO|nr:54S ribosomal protein L10, mitochondrial [[Candida] railenensis]